MLPKEAGFNVEKHITSPPTGLLIIFFIAEKPVMGFSLTEMLGRYLRKNGVQNARFFQCFYIQAELKVNEIRNVLFTNILRQPWKLKSCTIIISNKKKKHGWIFIFKEIISLCVSLIYIVSYLHENEEPDHFFNPSCSLVFIIA